LCHSYGIPVLRGCCVRAVTSNFTLEAFPQVNVPLGPVEESTGDRLFKTGGGLQFRGNFHLPFLSMLSTGMLLNLDFLPFGAETMTVLGFGPEAAVTLSPVTRFNLRAGFGGGLYLAMIEAGTVRNPFLTGGVEASYLLNPGLSLGLSVNYRRLLLPDSYLYDGISVSFGARWHVGAGGGSRIEYSPMIEPVFPLFYSYYDDHALGELVIGNGEADAIYNVQVSFYVPRYMDQPKPCGETIGQIPRSGSTNVPIYALFTDDIFDVTESDTAAGEILVSYDYLGSRMEQSIAVSVDINNRNALTWDDDRKVAALVTSKDPVVLGFAKGIAGTIRAEDTTAVNDTFRIALGLFEAIQVYGINYIPDPSTPYIELSDNPTAVDYCQFPSQTFAYRAGDCDDLAILYAALLESVGIETAFVTAPGHIYLAFNIGMHREDAEDLFDNPSDLIFRGDEVWIPVEVTLVRDGFLRAWQVAAREWRETSTSETAGFFPVRQAWELYEPVGFAGNQGIISVPDGDEVMEEYRENMDRFVDRQLVNRVEELNSQIASTRNNLRYINRLGILYARFGRLEDAAIQFRRVISQREYGPALVNLGHIAYLSGDFQRAISYYNRAIPVSSNAAAALVGLAKAEYEMENYPVVDEALAMLEEIDPEAANEISYLGTGVENDGSRASEALERNIYRWDQEEDL
jgi:tetratricopeptide (TPR) repeat protein